MKLEEIKQAVDAGKTVHWSNKGYQVIKDRFDHYLIGWDTQLPYLEKYYIGLTQKDGITLHGEESEFFIA